MQVQQEPDPILASPAQRLLAVVLDVFIAACAYWVLEALLGNLLGIEVVTDVALMLVTTLVWLAIHGWLLHAYGQTLGKHIVGIRVVGKDLGRAGILRAWFFRKFPYSVVLFVFAYFGLEEMRFGFNLAFPLFVVSILSPSRRALHDYWAATIVVRTPIRLLQQRSGWSTMESDARELS